MLQSSLGFHTLLLSIKLTSNDADKLLKHFKTYSKQTGRLKIYPLENPKRIIRRVHGKHSREIKMTYRVQFHREDKGIEWTIRFNKFSRDFQSYILDVEINPKILSGINDYLTAATYSDIGTTETNFNRISSEISPLLQRFSDYRLKRIDYCVNFLLNELGINCTPGKMVLLLKRSDIPPHYEEYQKYNETSHRMKSPPESHYLTSNSAHINCYSKYMELMNRSKKLVALGRPPISIETLKKAHDVFRFEVQCKRQKVYRMSTTSRDMGVSLNDELRHLLSNEYCYTVIYEYFYKVIKKGDWYTLNGAIREIERKGFNKQKEERLIHALKFINDCRSISKAKSVYKGEELESFKRTLKDLDSLRINPVTIPRGWGISYIPNLLYTYCEKVNAEYNRDYFEKKKRDFFTEYIKKNGLSSLK